MYLCIFIDNFVKLIYTFTIRTFFSLNIQNSSLIEKISDIQEKLKSELGEHDIRWEDPSKFHLTLRFLGNIDEETSKILIEELDGKDLGFNKIIFETKAIGFFPNQKFPNVIFLELSEKEGNSYKLAEVIENVVKRLGFERDKKFIPHVTLGRFRKGKRKRMDSMQHITAGDFKIEMDSFYLMKSIMSNKGSSYEKIKEFHFM